MRLPKEVTQIQCITNPRSCQNWLTAGQALARVLLLAAANGVNATYLNHPIQVEHLRPLLRDTIKMPVQPQLLLAMGYALSVSPPVPRRPIEEILLQE